MRILQLTKKFPYPAKDGESVAILAIAKGYFKESHSVDLLAMNTRKHNVNLSQLEGLEQYYRQYWTVEVDTDVKAIDAFKNLFTSRSYNVDRYDIDDFRSKLADVLHKNKYDIVHLETLYLTPYIDTLRELTDAKLVLRSHNIEHEIWYNLATTESNLLRKSYYKLCYRRLKKYELSQMNQYDRILSITDADKNKYNSFDVEVPVDTAPVGIDLSRYDVSDKSSDSIEVGYIGSLDWRPNIEGLTWFFSDIWPLIHEEHPSLVFHLAGRNASLDFIENLPLGVKYHGEVDDAILFISKLDGVIVPLLSGSGIRIKILESMAMSKTVFSTDKGFEGISIVDQKNGIIFNNPLEMKVKFRDWMNNFNVQTIGSQARELISNQFNITSIAQSIIESLNDNKI